MRDNFLDSQNFCAQIEFISRESILSSIFSTRSVSDNSKCPSTRFENSFCIKTRNLQDLIGLAILSWYIDPRIGILLRLDLREKIKNNFDLEVLEFFLYSKGEMLSFLIETNLWHTRDFFGNIFNKDKNVRLLRLVRPRFKTRRKPKRVQRHRGYRDKGSRRKDEEKHSLWISTDEQLKIEEERKIHKDSILLLRNFIN